MTSTATLEGILSVTAALEADSRPIHRLYIHQKKRYEREHSRLAHWATKKDIPVEYVDETVIAEHTEGNTHGGVVALVGERRFVNLEDLLADKPLVAMLDGVEDPFNFGYAVRSLYAAGFHGLVVRPRNWTTATAVVGRASAGAAEQMPMAIAETAETAADFYQARGLTIATTAKTAGTVDLYDADLTVPLFILIGGERRGITRSFLDKADLFLQIPYGRDFGQSLGTVAAASVVAFEIARQRMLQK